jgi:hypothetical protein
MRIFGFKDFDGNKIGIAAKSYGEAKPKADTQAFQNTGNNGPKGQAFFQTVTDDYDQYLEDAATEYMNRSE